jgi:hypothetical protein
MKGVSRKPGVLMASGAYDIENGFLCALDYVTIHNPRDDEWPRKAKDALDIRDGFDGYAGAHRPVVSDEPIGADENNKPGSRSNVPDDFFYFGATVQVDGRRRDVPLDRRGLRARTRARPGGRRARVLRRDVGGAR